MGRVVLKREEVTQELVKQVFDYRDGNLFWKNPKAKWIKVGDLVGCIGSQGYRVTHVFGKLYLVHRLIWFYHYGEWPDLLDHIDQNRENNCIENLRPICKSLNSYNTNKLWGHNTSGVRGVCFNRKTGKYIARAMVNGKYKYLGSFQDKEQAIKIRKQAERSLGQ